MTFHKKLRSVMRVVTIIVLLLFLCFLIYSLRKGVFSSKYRFAIAIRKYGVFSPLFFLFLQIIQVVFPIIPGGVSSLAGVLAFGPFLGFLYNYIGLSLGGFLAYFLSRKFGLSFIEKLFSKKTVDKYLSYIQNENFLKVFLLGILLPFAPDDLLCYIAGISGMKFSVFSFILLLGKPITLIFYSCFLNYFL